MLSKFITVIISQYTYHYAAHPKFNYIMIYCNYVYLNKNWKKKRKIISDHRQSINSKLGV